MQIASVSAKTTLRWYLRLCCKEYLLIGNGKDLSLRKREEVPPLERRKVPRSEKGERSLPLKGERFPAWKKGKIISQVPPRKMGKRSLTLRPNS
jgi:hypothetical protein